MDREAIEDLFAAAGRFSVRRMFGGHGIFEADAMIAIEVAGTVYLKSDALTQARFEAQACEPFAYDTKAGRRTITSYRRMPEEAFDDPDALRDWVVMARDAALRAARSRKPAVRRTRPREET